MLSTSITGITSPLNPKHRAATLLFIKSHSKTTSLEGHTHTKLKCTCDNSKVIINTIWQTPSTFIKRHFYKCPFRTSERKTKTNTDSFIVHSKQTPNFAWVSLNASHSGQLLLQVNFPSASYSVRVQDIPERKCLSEIQNYIQ